MYRPFREFHTLKLLEGYSAQELPLDYFISNYFRLNKAIGSKDRGVIADTVYALVRWERLLDVFCSEQGNWEQRLDAYKHQEFVQAQENPSLPLPVRLSVPDALFRRLVDSHGVDKAVELCRVCNTQAPTAIRVNTLKITRSNLLKLWKGKYDVKLCLHSANGIIFNKKINFYELPEFKQGYFEVQDEGSQLVAALVEAQPGDLVMDYCAGAGGKALAFAPGMGNKGQIYLHDIRRYALQDAKKRLARAGIQNAQIAVSEEPKLEKLKKRMDWVIVDVPCSGTGTYRRNPNMKWKFDDALVDKLIGQQRTIFEKALSFLKPGGTIVYATCSILNEENGNQIEHFLKTYPLVLAREPFYSVPEVGGMDGFFAAVLKKV